jgi:hypothetical protein
MLEFEPTVSITGSPNVQDNLPEDEENSSPAVLTIDCEYPQCEIISISSNELSSLIVQMYNKWEDCKKEKPRRYDEVSL